MRRLLTIVLGGSLLLTVQMPALAQQGAAANEGVVNFTFDQVDVRTFVKLVG